MQAAQLAIRVGEDAELVERVARDRPHRVRERGEWLERAAELLGEDAVSCHHGSLATDLRLDTEQRLKNGQIKAVVATAYAGFLLGGDWVWLGIVTFPVLALLDTLAPG